MHYQNIDKSKIRQEGRLPTAIKYSDEALEIANGHLNGNTAGVFRAVPYGLYMIMDYMDGVFNMFLSDTDSTFADEN